jgi:hypothetical protein
VLPLTNVMTVEQRATILRRLGPAAPPVVLLGDLDAGQPMTRDIPDPFGHSIDIFRACFDRIDRCVAVLARGLVLDSRRDASARYDPQSRSAPCAS